MDGINRSGHPNSHNINRLPVSAKTAGRSVRTVTPSTILPKKAHHPIKALKEYQIQPVYSQDNFELIQELQPVLLTLSSCMNAFCSLLDAIEKDEQAKHSFPKKQTNHALFHPPMDKDLFKTLNLFRQTLEISGRIIEQLPLSPTSRTHSPGINTNHMTSSAFSEKTRQKDIQHKASWQETQRTPKQREFQPRKETPPSSLKPASSLSEEDLTLPAPTQEIQIQANDRQVPELEKQVAITNKRLNEKVAFIEKTQQQIQRQAQTIEERSSQLDNQKAAYLEQQQKIGQLKKKLSDNKNQLQKDNEIPSSETPERNNKRETREKTLLKAEIMELQQHLSKARNDKQEIQRQLKETQDRLNQSQPKQDKKIHSLGNSANNNEQIRLKAKITKLQQYLSRASDKKQGLQQQLKQTEAQLRETQHQYNQLLQNQNQQLAKKLTQKSGQQQETTIQEPLIVVPEKPSTSSGIYSDTPPPGSEERKPSPKSQLIPLHKLANKRQYQSGYIERGTDKLPIYISYETGRQYIAYDDTYGIELKNNKIIPTRYGDICREDEQFIIAEPDEYLTRRNGEVIPVKNEQLLIQQINTLLSRQDMEPRAKLDQLFDHYHDNFFCNNDLHLSRRATYQFLRLYKQVIQEEPGKDPRLKAKRLQALAQLKQSLAAIPEGHSHETQLIQVITQCAGRIREKNLVKQMDGLEFCGVFASAYLLWHIDPEKATERILHLAHVAFNGSERQKARTFPNHYRTEQYKEPVVDQLFVTSLQKNAIDGHQTGSTIHHDAYALEQLGIPASLFKPSVQDNTQQQHAGLEELSALTHNGLSLRVEITETFASALQNAMDKNPRHRKAGILSDISHQLKPSVTEQDFEHTVIIDKIILPSQFPAGKVKVKIHSWGEHNWLDLSAKVFLKHIQLENTLIIGKKINSAQIQAIEKVIPLPDNHYHILPSGQPMNVFYTEECDTRFYVDDTGTCLELKPQTLYQQNYADVFYLDQTRFWLADKPKGEMLIPVSAHAVIKLKKGRPRANVYLSSDDQWYALTENQPHDPIKLEHGKKVQLSSDRWAEIKEDGKVYTYSQ
ncbi:hypothetical protein CI610_01822 [invertebrate metagenome]|uniref:Uncharacterized protein n=1 Tax=invertebrate metagenome TaxID=1711999 RepID=A0A2H9T7L8_9ZZZZ